MVGCLITKWDSVWLVGGEPPTRRWVRTPTAGCVARALAVGLVVADEVEVYAPVDNTRENERRPITNELIPASRASIRYTLSSATLACSWPGSTVLPR